MKRKENNGSTATKDPSLSLAFLFTKLLMNYSKEEKQIQKNVNSKNLVPSYKIFRGNTMLNINNDV
jgi:hypothetical protein